MKPLSRRDFLKMGGLAFLGTAGATAVNQTDQGHPHHNIPPADHGEQGHSPTHSLLLEESLAGIIRLACARAPANPWRKRQGRPSWPPPCFFNITHR